MEGETRSNPGPYLLIFLTPLALRALLRGRDERRLQLRHVLALEEKTQGRVDVRVPRVAGHDAVRQRAGQLVGLPLLECPLQIRVVQLRVRILSCRNRALPRIEVLLR